MTEEELYRKLQQHLDRMPIGFPATESGVEIRILKQLFATEEATIALELSALLEPVRAIHKRFKSKMTLAELTQALDRMANKGIIQKFPIKGEMGYGKIILARQKNSWVSSGSGSLPSV